MTKVEVKPSVLQWAMKRADRLDKLKDQFPHIDKWISQESQPTLKQLEKLAKATSIPLGYFFLPNPPEEKLSIPHYRTVRDEGAVQPSPNLLETVQTMERRQQWMRDYLIQHGHPPLNYVGRANLSTDPKLVAQTMRETLGLESDWASKQPNWQEALRNLIKKIEDIGIIVVINGVVGNNTHRKLDVAEFRGFVLIDDYAPFIFVNGRDGKAAQMFTLAHELAHVWYGASAVFDLANLQPADIEIESVCNQAAAEFLAPEDEVLHLWKRVGTSDDRFKQIARYFKVSEIVAARRTLDLNLITKEEFFSFYEAYVKRLRQEAEEMKTEGGGNFYATQNMRIGRRFAEAVIRAAKEGTILYREAYRLTGLSGNTFDKFAEYVDAGRSV
ncbi:ImmA/IrrE family metallo-endopeptidase [Anoxybacteroides tepidamans]|uniref:ImmA/IrrE family metallo-endopeptidase n=1 Tax=Anoxybacteroides tepidamans TaxID=265948 RepID=UPI000482CFD6|nr:ImmA/IrrE family metallo-endopeptidase [Anoxybacillus tepidamans]